MYLKIIYYSIWQKTCPIFKRGAQLVEVMEDLLIYTSAVWLGNKAEYYIDFHDTNNEDQHFHQIT